VRSNNQGNERRNRTNEEAENETKRQQNAGKGFRSLPKTKRGFCCVVPSLSCSEQEDFLFIITAEEHDIYTQICLHFHLCGLLGQGWSNQSKYKSFLLSAPHNFFTHLQISKLLLLFFYRVLVLFFILWSNNDNRNNTMVTCSVIQ